jgi:hypothetical protein
MDRWTSSWKFQQFWGERRVPGIWSNICWYVWDTWGTSTINAKVVNPKSKVIKPQRNNTVALQHTGIPPEFGHMMRSSVSYVALGGPKTLDVEPPSVARWLSMSRHCPGVPSQKWAPNDRFPADWRKPVNLTNQKEDWELICSRLGKLLFD